MSRQANKTVIGGFVIGAVILLVAGILVFGGGKLFSERIKFVLYFDGSVKGLGIGAPVVFRGVNIGSVKQISLNYDSDNMVFQIPVIIEIEPGRITPAGNVPGSRAAGTIVRAFVDKGLRAKLNLQSVVTGQMMIELGFHPDKPARMIGKDKAYPEIPTIPTSWETLAKTLQQIPYEEIITNLARSIQGIERTINRPEINDSITTLNGLLIDARALVQGIDDHVDPLITGVNKAVSDIDQLTITANEKLVRLGEGFERSEKEIEQLISDIRKAAISAQTALDRVGSTFASVQDAVENNVQIPYQISEVLEELAAATRTIRTLAEYLEQYPDALLRGKGASGGER